VNQLQDPAISNLLSQAAKQSLVMDSVEESKGVRNRFD
jgi:hypothetical protein